MNGREKVKKNIRKMKAGKQPGPDKIKGEIYKWMAESDICIGALTSSLNGVTGAGRTLES